MRVLVSGGAGYIGSHTVIKLVEAGHDVVIVDDFSNAKPTVIGRLEALTGVHLPVHAFNLTDYDKTEHLFAGEQIDAVIHFAGFKAVGESVAKPLDYYQNNLDSTFSLLRAMRRHDVHTLVFSSSATVYGAEPVLPMTEDSPTSATNPYGWTKVMIEQVLRDVAASDESWRIAALRYFNPVGAHPSGRSARTPPASPTTSCPSSRRSPSGVARNCRCSVTTTPPPTARVCATTSTSTISRPVTWRHSNASAGMTSRCRCGISVRAKGFRFSR